MKRRANALVKGEEINVIAGADGAESGDAHDDFDLAKVGSTNERLEHKRRVFEQQVHLAMCNKKD